MNLWRAILSVVLLMGVTGCVSWQRVPRAQDGALALSTAGPVRLTLTDGTVVVLERPRIQGDSLVGERSGSHARVAVALRDLERAEDRRVDGRKLLAGAGATAKVGLILGLLVIALMISSIPAP